MGAGLWPEGVPIPGSAPRARTVQQQPVGTPMALDAPPPTNPIAGVEWSLSFIGLLGFVLAITTYAINIGQASIIVGLIGLLLQRRPIRVPVLLQWLGVFFLWCIVGYMFTRYSAIVFEEMVTLGKIWLVALVAANALTSRAQIRFFQFFYLGCFALFPLRGALFNYYVYGQTTFGRAIWKFVYENPNDLAAYCILQLSLALALYYRERWNWLRICALLGVLFLPFLVLLTRSRGAFLALATFVALLVAGGRKRARAAVLTVLAAVIVLAVAPSNVLERLGGLSSLTSTETVKQADQEGSAYQRYTIWKVARLVISEHPITGVGLGAYPATHRIYAQRPQFDPTARGARDTHSLYLNVLAETGVIGFLLYVIAYGTTLFQANRVRRRCRELMPVSSQALRVQMLGVFAFFLAGIFGSFAHVSFLILQMTAVWAFMKVIEDELNTGGVRTGVVGQGYAPALAPAPPTR